MGDELKTLFWIASSRKDLKAFPEEVRRAMGYALRFAQAGRRHETAKVLKGFGGAGVLEVVDDYDGDTYRAAYTVKFKSGVYVLHVFQKKSKRGAKTPQVEIDVVKRRLKAAAERDKAVMEGDYGRGKQD